MEEKNTLCMIPHNFTEITWSPGPDCLPQSKCPSWGMWNAPGAQASVESLSGLAQEADQEKRALLCADYF